MAMAVAGMGCRAPSAMLVRPASVMRLLPTCSAMNPCGTSQISSSAVQNSWRAGSRLGFLGLGEERNRKAVSRSSPPRRFFVKAIDVSGPGSVDSPLMQSMQAKIKEGLNAESVSVKDAYGDGRHVCIEVVASVFEGKSAVNRQRLVYKAIWEELQEKVHAVDQLKTRTPSEAANAPGRL